MNRCLLWLVLAALAAAALAATGVSQASFTTASTTQITASADHSGNWLHVYSKISDPDVADRAGYANEYGVTPATPCATGQDEGTAINLGVFPTWTSGNYTFTRVITVKTPLAFPVPADAPITVTVSTVADADTGQQPLTNVGLAVIGDTGAATSATMNVNQKLQLNLHVQTTWYWSWFYGSSYTPHIKLTITFAGSPAAYYVYDYPILVRLG